MVEKRTAEHESISHPDRPARVRILPITTFRQLVQRPLELLTRNSSSLEALGKWFVPQIAEKVGASSTKACTQYFVYFAVRRNHMLEYYYKLTYCSSNKSALT